MRKQKPQDAPVDSGAISILENPWDNVYWFARMLINSDRYGGVGADSATMVSVFSGLRSILDSPRRQDDESLIIATSLEFIRDIFLKRWGHTKKKSAVQFLVHDLSERITTVTDLEVLCLTLEQVLVPINESIKLIPSDDRVFAESVVNALLKTRGEAGLKEVINIWDNLGLYGCLAAERSEMVKRLHCPKWISDQIIQSRRNGHCPFCFLPRIRTKSRSEKKGPSRTWC